ncbi:MAG: hypothetical protein EB117_18035, partial [Betaproteobacteria bacterium]|nr:hypothetical protein [Betaproteobacteria bacterium]
GGVLPTVAPVKQETTGGVLPTVSDTMAGTGATEPVTTTGVLPVSRDEAQQTAIDAETVKPAEEVGTYRGVPIPTFAPIYGFQEESGTILQTPEQQLQAWKANQDRIAGLNPAQRAIENAARTESQENALVTTYDPVTFNGKDWTVTAGGNSLMRLADDQSGLGPKQYRYEELDAATGQIRQGIGVEGPGLLKGFLTNPITGLILSVALPGVGTAIGQTLGITNAALAQAVGSNIAKFGLQIAGGKTPIDALKNVVVADLMQGVTSTVSSMLPTELSSVGKQVVNQLVTTGKIDPASLATTAGAEFAAGQLANETGMKKSDALTVITAGLRTIQGDPMGAATMLFGSAVKAGSKEAQAQQVYVNAKNSGASDAEAYAAAEAFYGRDVIDPRISGQGVGGSDFEDYGGRDEFRGGLQNVLDTLTGALGNDT